MSRRKLWISRKRKNIRCRRKILQQISKRREVEDVFSSSVYLFLALYTFNMRNSQVSKENLVNFSEILLLLFLLFFHDFAPVRIYYFQSVIPQRSAFQNRYPVLSTFPKFVSMLFINLIQVHISMEHVLTH